MGVGFEPSLVNHATHSITGKSRYSVSSTCKTNPVNGSLPSNTVSKILESMVLRLRVGFHSLGIPRTGLPSRTKETGISAGDEKNRSRNPRLLAISSGRIADIAFEFMLTTLSAR